MVSPIDVVRGHAGTLADKAGLDVVDVQIKGSGARTLVRVTVDRKGGVDLAQCQELSRDLSRLLDEADPIPTRYQLEVTSPGVNHPLRTPRDFDRIEGRTVVIRRGADGMEEVRGSVRRAAEDAVVLEVGDDEVPVAYADIVSAKQVLPW